MCVKVCQGVLNKGIEKYITIRQALKEPLPLSTEQMYVNVVKSVSECFEQLYRETYYNHLGDTELIAIGVGVNVCKCV